VTCQTPTRKSVSQLVQCELMKESVLVLEDKDMQIMMPQVVYNTPPPLQPIKMSTVSN
jgi:hypothetical protein